VPEPFFIVGSPRSGTTLLERLLSRHSRIFVSPETEFFFLLSQLGYTEAPFSEARLREFLARYRERRPAQLIGLHHMDDLPDRLLADGPRDFGDVFVKLLEVLAGGPDAKPVRGEKTPHHLRCLDYIMQSFTRAPIIAMIRDGRAVVRSALDHPRWERNLLGASRQWAGDARILRRVLRTEERWRVLSVSYERLVTNPEAVLVEVCAFLGERFEPGMLDDDPDRPRRFEVYYGQPWMSRSVQGIDPSRADSWRSEYSPAALALVEHELGEELRALGYAELADPEASWRGLWAREWLRHQGFRARRRLMRPLR
jgi:hypothetical protein